MSIPKPWLPFVMDCATRPGPLQPKAERLVQSHKASAARKLVKSRPRRKAAKATRLLETGATRAVREAVVARAGNRSELSGARGTMEMDHYFGRDVETVETCWLLTKEEHLARTDNRIPGTSTYSRLWWHESFQGFCRRKNFGRALALLEPLIALELGQHPPKEITSL